MSRLKKFTRSLFSGYVALGATAFYTMGTIPLALHYLKPAEFGLWTLVATISGYLALIDLSMSASLGRILIDHKDERGNGIYGGMVKTGMWVSLVQGIIIVFVGVALSLLASHLPKVPRELQEEFRQLLIGQSILTGASFAMRIFSQLLYAHQRLDVANYSASIFFVVGVSVMWLGFAGGLGIYSFLVSQAVLLLGNSAFNAVGCLRLGFLPQTGEWGQANWKYFRELFSFSQGLFLVSIGTQLVSASQTVLLTALLGLETVAVWNICTKVYTMLTMLVWRIIDYSAPAISEMVARREHTRLPGRLRDLTMLMVTLAIMGGTLFAAGNNSFVSVLTAGKISWPEVNNVLLALWFVASTIMRIHTGFVGMTKELGFLRFIFILEGVAFISLNLLCHHVESMTLMLFFSLACTLTFSLPYGLWRTCRYCGIKGIELVSWFRSSWQLGWRLVPLAMIIWWFTRHLPPVLQFTCNMTLTGLCALALLSRYGISETLKKECIERAPARMQKILIKLYLRH